MKVLSQKELLKLTPAALDTYMSDLKSHLTSIGPVLAENRAKQMNEIGVALDSFIPQINKILGREVNMGELASFAKARALGTLGKLTQSGTPGDKGKRLDDETKTKIKAELLAHCGALKAGTTPEPLSVIAARHGIQTQTLDTYKPTAAEVAALPGANEVPASRMQAVAA